MNKNFLVIFFFLFTVNFAQVLDLAQIEQILVPEGIGGEEFGQVEEVFVGEEGELTEEYTEEYTEEFIVEVELIL